MWILLVIRPRTLLDYIRMCRLYGMTMSDIRMQEAWAMAHWLARSEPPAYGIEDDTGSAYDLILWPDFAVTRVDVGSELLKGATRIYQAVPGSARLGFLTLQPDGRMKFHEQSISFIPFSTYDLGSRPAQSLCVRYSPPTRTTGQPQRLAPLPPRAATMIRHDVALSSQRFHLASAKDASLAPQAIPDSPFYGKLIRTTIKPSDCRLLAINM
jgi:hypothetical protein